MTMFLESHKWFRRVIVYICAYLSVLSLGKIMEISGDGQFGYKILSVLLFAFTAWMFNRFLLCKDCRLKIVSSLGGILLSVAIVYGAYAHFINDIFGSTGETFLQIGMVMSIGVLSSSALAELLVLLDKAGDKFLVSGLDTSESQKKYGVKIKAFYKKHLWAVFISYWISIALCHLPIFLANWPGNFVFDAKYQLANVITGDHSTHHPLIHTLMMGKAYEFGRSIGNVSAGYQLYTIAQLLILTASFAYALFYMYKKGTRTSYIVLSWMFFALFPMNPLFAISATKDVLCAAFFLFFMVFLVRYLWDRDNMRVISYIGMVVTGVLLALFRNNALYAVLVSAVIIVIAMKGWKEKGKLVALFALILILAKIVNAGLISYTGAIESDTYRETMCVPLQCLGRVASYHGDELNDEIYQEICHYIPEEYIKAYNPYNADAVKNNANEELLKTNTFNFFKLWAKVGMQFPDEYFESIVTNTMGYWYPLNQGRYVSADIALYHTLIGIGDELEKQSYCPLVNQIYDPLFYKGEYYKMPLLGYFFRNAPYIWGTIIFVLFGLYKKDKRILLTACLPIIYLLTCFCGPMAALRYIYSVIVCMPLLLYLILYCKNISRIKE